jgi:CheY-like chemotaxis protein
MACRNRILKQGSQKRLSLTRALTTHDLHQNPSFASRHMKERSMSDVFPEDPNNPHTAVPPRSQPLPSIITPSHDGATARSSSAPRILLVDDNAINLRLLVVFAKQQNLHYTEAANGLQALNAYKDKANSSNPPSRPFDFILMDVSMPVMDGLTSTRQIRAFEKKSGLTRSHIVALTGLASGQDQQDAQDAGVDTYLVKPVKFADVKRLLEPK